VKRKEWEKLMELRERLLENNGPNSLSAAWALWAIEQKMKRMGVSPTLGSTE